MYLAGNLAEYLKLVDDAVFELEEMASCVNADMEDELEDLSPHYLEIADYLRQVVANIKSERHQWGVKELEYMPLARRLRQVLPFYTLLREINHYHLNGGFSE